MSKSDFPNSLGQRLKMARIQAGLTQGQIAKLLEMHRPTISEIEADRRKVSAEEINSFCKHYKVSVNWLTGANTDDSDLKEAKVEFAARELSKISPDDLDKVMKLLKTLRK